MIARRSFGFVPLAPSNVDRHNGLRRDEVTQLVKALRLSPHVLSPKIAIAPSPKDWQR
ncbi:hypothetical protein AKJ09_04287 [Labilithrix luteola]|uniref:Uncharacterized protein n=1 Tax=Labilithrix luteola TaxID=1391654 RepID=A0A0K1PVR4_9BACT|nr:hypothetical protein AKJ09_04287 [Labilithrix luteola]